jgi:hypothetical protein
LGEGQKRIGVSLNRGVKIESAKTKLRAVKVGGKWRLTEISKKQRTILEKMGVGIPIDATLVIRKGGV